MKKAIKVLLEGGVAAIPTDTVYGLAAMPFDKKAVAKLYSVKGRSDRKPIALLVSSKADATRFAKSIPAKAKKLMDRYWPGPLTLVFRKKSSVPDFLTSGLSTIGIRMPKDLTALKIIRAAGGALAVTSANRSGGKPAVTAEEAGRLKNVDIVIKGKCAIGEPSSVVLVTGTGLKVLRKGPGLELDA